MRQTAPQTAHLGKLFMCRSKIFLAAEAPHSASGNGIFTKPKKKDFAPLSKRNARSKGNAFSKNTSFFLSFSFLGRCPKPHELLKKLDQNFERAIACLKIYFPRQTIVWR
ncbi:MAG: hypothetical protein IJZ37_06735, partial [Clostridia bacterium]|nr:hypothetical protein [Clostridia bacterium]